MYIKDLHLHLAHRTLPLWWLLFFCPHLIPAYPSATLACGLFLKHLCFKYLAFEVYCSSCSGILQVSYCLSFVLTFSFYFYSIKKNYFFIYFWLLLVFVAARRLSLVVANRCYSLFGCTGFSLQWLLLLQSTSSRNKGFSSCSTWAQ